MQLFLVTRSDVLQHANEKLFSPSPASQVLLLGVGGSQVYLGPSSLAIPYFAYHGFTQPKNENLSDFLIDVIQGNVSTSPSSSGFHSCSCFGDTGFDLLISLCNADFQVECGNNRDFDLEELCALWKRDGEAWVNAPRSSGDSLSPTQSYDHLGNSTSTSRNIPPLKRVRRPTGCLP